MVSIRLPLRRKRQANILDLPFADYDPNTLLPKEIPIGGKLVHPLVSIQDLKDHLTLLAAYYTLQHTLSNFARYSIRMSREYQRWAQIVIPRSESRRASVRQGSSSGSSPRSSASYTPSGGVLVGEKGKERAELTASPAPLDSAPLPAVDEPPRAPGELLDSEMPTLGVLMCWHAHMLNPRLYALECEGAYRGLKGKKFPLHRAAEAIRNNTLPDEVDFESEESSFVFQKTVWDPADIAAAVQRQMKFVNNMHKIGWLEENVWEKDCIALQRGAVRYHAWLDLMHSTANQYFLVPTLDIDLAWHTHQLQGRGYQKDSERVLGWFLGHDDQAAERKIGDGLAQTSKLWKRRFGYTYVF